jgi:uncharacterized membrane protein
MGLNSGLYKLLLVLHLLTVVVGLGTVSLNALYGRESRVRRGAAGLAITEANEFVSSVATYVIYLIPITGILLVLASDSIWKFSQTWLWLALVLYVVALGIVHGVVRPTVRKMIGLMRVMEAGPPPAGGPPPQVAQLEALGATMAKAGPALSVLLVTLTALMVWKPGI